MSKQILEIFNKISQVINSEKFTDQAKKDEIFELLRVESLRNNKFLTDLMEINTAPKQIEITNKSIWEIFLWPLKLHKKYPDENYDYLALEITKNLGNLALNKKCFYQAVLYKCEKPAMYILENFPSNASKIKLYTGFKTIIDNGLENLGMVYINKYFPSICKINMTSLIINSYEYAIDSPKLRTYIFNKYKEIFNTLSKTYEPCVNAVNGNKGKTIEKLLSNNLWFKDIKFKHIIKTFNTIILDDNATLVLNSLSQTLNNSFIGDFVNKQ